MHHAGRRLLLADLQARIAHLERGSRRPCETLRFGIPALDAHLPAHGLPLGLLHEVVEDGAGACHAATARLFVAGILARLNGPVLWCLARRDLFAPGLASVGLDPNRVIFVETVREADVLPAMEEGLRHCGLAAVVGELARLRFTPSRRLQLAAEASGVTAFALRRWREGAGLEATCLNDALAGRPGALVTAARARSWSRPLAGRTRPLPRRGAPVLAHGGVR